MRFVITGGTGFIGSHIAEALVEQGENVTVLDNLNTGKLDNLKEIIERIHFVNGDIRDYNLLKNLFQNVDGVYHQAALASVQESFTKPKEYHDVNVGGTENIFKLAKQMNFKVVYASSSSVYGNPVRIPIKETDPKNPINPYAQTKLDDEYLAEKYAKMGAKIIGMRYFNVFGKRQSKEYAGVIKKFLERVRSSQPPIINGDGLQSRDFVYVGDVVKANIMAMQSKVDHAFFNIGTNTTISVLELAKMMISLAGLNTKPIHGPALPGDVRITQADITGAKESFGWEPKVKLENWLRDIISDPNII
jgi:UDP-glucose 4-epimerase